MTEQTSGAALEEGGPGALTDVQRLAALGTYIRVLSAVEKDLRAAVTTQMGRDHDERKGAYLPDGTKIAAITHSDGNKTVKVTDEKAAHEWVAMRYGTEIEIISRIRPAFLKKLLDVAGSLPVGSNGLDPATGEVLPFIEVQQGNPYVTITTTEAGEDRMTALAHGFTAMLEAGK